MSISNIDIESRKQLVISQLGDDYIDAGGYEMRYQCPNCMTLGKTYNDYKLYVNYGETYQRGKRRGGMFWCHRCELKGKLNMNEPLESNSEVIDYLLNLNLTSQLIEEDEEPALFMIPKHKPVPGTLAWEYIMSRGLTEDDIEFFDIRVSGLDTRQFYGRIVIPNQITGKIFTDMYVARDYVGQASRYKNPYASNRNEIVFNLHRIPQGADRIIINEGCINSVVAGTNSVATYGKYVSDTQLKMILSKNPKEIVVSLDKDAYDKAQKLCDRIKSLSDNVRVRLIDFPDDRDAADLGREEYGKLVESAREYVSSTVFVIENFILGLEDR